jgi:hypothetical protein
VGITQIVYHGEPALFLSSPDFRIEILPAGATALTRMQSNVQIEACAYLPNDLSRESAIDDYRIENVSCLTDKDNNVWILELVAKQTLPTSFGKALGGEAGAYGVTYEDVMVLYKASFDGDTVSITGPVRAKQFFSYDSGSLVLGSHFRYGATAQILDENSFGVYSSTSLPGNISASALDSLFPNSLFTWKGLADTIFPPTLRINAFVPKETQMTFSNHLYQFECWLLSLPMFASTAPKDPGFAA